MAKSIADTTRGLVSVLLSMLVGVMFGLFYIRLILMFDFLIQRLSLVLLLLVYIPILALPFLGSFVVGTILTKNARRSAALGIVSTALVLIYFAIT